MKKRLVGAGHSLLLVAILMFGAAHAEGSGVRLNLGRFTLYVEHNDMVPDKIMGMEYLRTPDGLLFDLIGLVQDNREKLRASHKEIYAHVDGYNKYLAIYQNKPEEKRIFVDDDLTRLKKHKFIKHLCAAMDIDKCACRVDKDEIHFYVSDRELESEHADVIEFGQFPGMNNKKYSLTDRWALGTAGSSGPEFEKVTVTRDSIYEYFDILGANE